MHQEHMVDETKYAGLIQVLSERIESQPLPRALSIKEQVDRGETLSDFDDERSDPLRR